MALLECKNVCVNYGSFEACKNVTFQINQGDYVCVVGANGSGKSTLVQATLGLTKIKSGSILRNKIGIGYLPQKNIISRDFPATVKEVVLSGCTANGNIFFSKNDRENAKKQMARLGLDSIENRPFSDLSGGQQQRVLLARALCAAKQLLVLDEPVTGLDPFVTDELYSIIRKLNKEEHIAVLMVSHDVHRALQNATHILHMNNEPLFFGSASEYQKSQFYSTMSNIEVCETHLCTHCGTDCNATHIHLPGKFKHD